MLWTSSLFSSLDSITMEMERTLSSGLVLPIDLVRKASLSLTSMESELLLVARVAKESYIDSSPSQHKHLGAVFQQGLHLETAGQ